jgi:hypothetical protein
MKKIKTFSFKAWAMALVLTALTFSACEKLIDVGQPKAQLSATSVFESEHTTRAVLNNLYGSASPWISGGQSSPTMFGTLASDEADVYSTSNEVKQLGAGQLIPSNPISSSLWPACYLTVYNANTLIEGTMDNSNISASLAKQVRGEALFFRALAHLTLMGFYGDIPIVTSTDYRENTTKKRSSPAEVLTQVISDLEESASLLPADYAISSGERIRVNSHGAKALLARAYLYNGNLEKAETISSEVISASTLYALLPLSEVFLKNSKEAILQFKANSTTINSGDGGQFVLTGRPTYLALKNSFYDGFETGDLRRDSWTGKVTVGAESWYFPYKYKVKSSTTISEYSTLLRLSEQYLIRAEARAKLNKLPLAITDLDAIRSRAGLIRISISNPTISQTDLLERIFSERRSELFTEWAHRWIDLKRFGKAQNILTAVKTGWKPSALLFPIPQTEINVNQNLGQNPGY